jgi:hypothetical protein
VTSPPASPRFGPLRGSGCLAPRFDNRSRHAVGGRGLRGLAGSIAFLPRGGGRDRTCQLAFRRVAVRRPMFAHRIVGEPPQPRCLAPKSGNSGSSGEQAAAARRARGDAGCRSQTIRPKTRKLQAPQRCQAPSHRPTAEGEKLNPSLIISLGSGRRHGRWATSDAGCRDRAGRGDGSRRRAPGRCRSCSRVRAVRPEAPTGWRWRRDRR